MSYPTTMEQLLPRLQEAARAGDAGLVRQMLAWGDAQIDVAYGRHLLLRPDRYLLKWRARRAWRRIARDTAALERAAVSRDLATLLGPGQVQLAPQRQAAIAEAMQQEWEHQRRAWEQ